MYLDASFQYLRQNPIRHRLHLLFAQLAENSGITSLDPLFRRMDRFAYSSLIKPVSGRGITAWLVARGADIVGVEAGVDGGEVGESGGVGCAVDAAGGVDRGVNRFRRIGDIVEAGDLAFAMSFVLGLGPFEEVVEAFGVAWDSDFPGWRIGKLGHYV